MLIDYKSNQNYHFRKLRFAVQEVKKFISFNKRENELNLKNFIAAGDPCNLPLQVGRGSSSIQRWYFNQISRQCELFTYSGIGGNANNFFTRTSCSAR